MRRVLALLLCLASPMAFAANPALGIHNISGYINASTYTSPTGQTSQTSGSAFVVFASDPDGAAAAMHVSDSEGNTYTLAALGTGSNPVEDANDGVWLFAFVCVGSCTGGANHTVTVTNSAGATLRIVEFVEIKNASALDAGASAYVVGSTLSNPVTPTTAGDLIVANGMTGGSGYTIAPTASGWSALESTASSESMGSGTLSSAAASTQNATLGGVAGEGFAGITLAFKGSGGGATCTHAGQAKNGSVSVPNGTSGEYWSKSGTWVTPDCSAVEYWSPQLGNWTVN